MSDYISRRLLLDLIDELGSCDAEHDTWARGYDDAIDEVYKMVIRTPAADVAPVKHGEWIWHEEQFEYECSACHLSFDYNHTFDLFDHGFQYADYCPNCGAKMDRGADND